MENVTLSDWLTKRRRVNRGAVDEHKARLLALVDHLAVSRV